MRPGAVSAALRSPYTWGRGFWTHPPSASRGAQAVPTSPERTGLGEGTWPQVPDHCSTSTWLGSPARVPPLESIPATDMYRLPLGQPVTWDKSLL